MKICLIGTVASSTLNFRKNLIQLLKLQGHEIHVFATDYTSDTKSAILKIGGIPVDYNLNRGGLNPFSDIKNTFHLKNIIKDISPDIVFSYFSKPVIFGTFAAKMAGVPRILGMLEGLGFTFTKTSNSKTEEIKKTILKKIQILLYRLAFKYLKKIIFLNPDDYSDLVINNNINVSSYSILGGIGVDIEYFSYSTPSINPIRFIFIGRLLKEKGIYEYIEAAKIVKALHPETEFVVLGSIDNENPSALTQKQLNLLMEDKIIIHPGHVNDVRAWLQGSSVFVLPSYREGVPCSTQEALASGLPIITTDVPGCRETINTELNGFLVPPWSSESIAEKMLFFIDNPHEILKKGHQSRILAERKFNEKSKNISLASYILG